MSQHVLAADAFTTLRQRLWDLLYRVTGSVTDADLLLRDCFERAIEQPAEERGADWRLNLTRSAAALGMETYRQRRRRNYVGPWLPSLIETGDAASPGPGPTSGRYATRPASTGLVASAFADATAAARYDMVESSSMAFLRALEALEPRERLIFVMSDALGHDPFELPSMFDVPASVVRASLQAARRTMEAYDATRTAPTREVQADTAEALHHCLSHMQQHHTAALEKICAPDVEAVFDSAGEFVAPLGLVRGADRVARLLIKFVEGSAPLELAFRMLNAMPAALGTSSARPRWARRFAFRVDIRDGLISDVQMFLAAAKLAAVRFD